jgi:NAD-dependent histone deacetylase SIR2
LPSFPIPLCKLLTLAVNLGRQSFTRPIMAVSSRSSCNSPSASVNPGCLTINEHDLDRKSLNSLLLRLNSCKKVIVVTGAGCSVTSGIPDFRSAGGLYSQVKERFPKAVAKGQDLFDLNFFHTPTNRPVFFRFMGLLKEMIDQAKPTKLHQFLKTLKDCNLLNRVYTQNIDQLEERAGLLDLPWKDPKRPPVVLLHGTMQTVKCIICKDSVEFTQSIIEPYKEGLSVECAKCKDKSEKRIAMGRRAISTGIYRPDIVLYNEPHPEGEEISSILSADLAKHPDALLVIGTSLKVAGIKKLVKDVAREVKLSSGPVIYINKTALTAASEWKSFFSYELVGCADFWADFLQREWISTRRLASTKIDQYFILQKKILKSAGAPEAKEIEELEK